MTDVQENRAIVLSIALNVIGLAAEIYLIYQQHDWIRDIPHALGTKFWIFESITVTCILFSSWIWCFCWARRIAARWVLRQGHPPLSRPKG